MSSPPTGTVTFLFTDIEGSTRLEQAHPAAWESARRRHHAILRETVEAHRGHVFQIVGDAFCVAFPTASDGLRATISAQRALQVEAWGETPIHARMGLHTGAAEFPDGEYHGYLTLAHAQRVMSSAYGGQMLVSNASAGLLAGQLPDSVTLRDMGDHRLKGLLNPERLWQVVSPDLPQNFPPLQSLNTVPNNLPIQVTSFVGREHELAELQRLLGRTRLLTLTGSGGTGKTRLSLQVAAEVLDRYKDGIWFVELAPLADASLVPQTVALALGVREEQGRPIQMTLLDWLRTRQLLLVLDNCEHLIDACAKFSDAVLHAGQELQILASTREALGIAGETAYRVPSLECPSVEQASHAPVEQLAQYAAVQLFIDRATQLQTTFTVTNANAPAVAQICYRLDGIPLAIELAAARVKALSVEQIAERLDDRFRLLTGGSRTALPRQQTLRALIDWSYSLLSEPECILLQRLSVFAGGWTLEAAENVCADENIAQHEILDLLLRLQDKSLVVTVGRERHSRYRLLETIRLYARDKLDASGQSEHLRKRHLQWFTQLAETSGPKMRSADHMKVMAILEEDFDNIRAAITWAIERQSEAALRVVGALYEFWNTNARWQEGWTTATLALVSASDLPPLGSETSSDPLFKGAANRSRARAEARIFAMIGMQAFVRGDYLDAQARFQAAEARARESGDGKFLGDILIRQGLVQLYQDEYKAARALLEQSVMLARHDGDVWGIAWALWLLGDAVAIGDPARARMVYQESLSLFRKDGDRYRTSFPLTSLARLASEEGDYAQARALLEESLAIRREQADQYMLSISLNSLAEVMSNQRDYESAAPICEEALRLSRAVGNKSGIAWSLRNLASVAVGRDDAYRAEELLRESLSLYRDLGQKRDIILVIESLAKISLAQERPVRATTLLGAANTLRASIKAPRSPNLQFVHDQNVATGRAKLDPAVFDSAWAEGSALTLEQAIALALRDNL